MILGRMIDKREVSKLFKKKAVSSARIEDVTLDNGRVMPCVVIRRFDEDKYPFNIGMGRAQLIVEHIEEIRKFYEGNKNQSKGDQTHVRTYEGNGR